MFEKRENNVKAFHVVCPRAAPAFEKRSQVARYCSGQNMYWVWKHSEAVLWPKAWQRSSWNYHIVTIICGYYIFCEFLRFGKNRKIKYPQKFLPTHHDQVPWCVYHHKLRDVFHSGSCIIILFRSSLPFLFFLYVPSRPRKSDVWCYRITGARCTMWHLREDDMYLRCSNFSQDTAPFTKPAFKVKSFYLWLREIAKFRSTSWNRKK